MTEDGWQPESRGLLIGDAAALLGVTPKAIRLYHQRGLVPEAPRDANGYRRYRSADLARLARIVRLRDIGLSLREIAPLLPADDGGAALRQALQDLDDQLAAEVADRQRRRRLLGRLRDELIGDPLDAATPSVTEERLIARLRDALPAMTVEEEAFERRLQRALDAFRLPGTDLAGVDQGEALADELLEATGGLEELANRHRRLYALVDAEVGDPRVLALAEDMRAVMRQAAAAVLDGTDAADGWPEHDEAELERWFAALTAALGTLPPAVRRVWELVYAELMDRFPNALDLKCT